MYKTIREKTKAVYVGNVQIGGNNKVVIQSMTTTKTHDVEKTVAQVKELVREGCELVRIAVLDDEDAAAFGEVVKNSPCPIIADIHFNPLYAIKAIESGAAKVRLNPGNIKDEEQLRKIIDLANKKNIPIRVGVNSGSLPMDLMKSHGVTADAMMIAVKRYINLFESNGFNNIVVSLKATNVLLAIEAYKKAAMEFNYPLHIGITEAGSLFNGTIKSAAGLGVLLHEGIGNTIRISLTGDPLSEVKVCKKLLNSLGLYDNLVDIISCPTCGRLNFDLNPVVKEIEKFTRKMNFPLKVAILGCAVNGPGEAKEADIGIAGGNGTGIIFANGKAIKSVPEDQLVDELKKLISIKYKEYLDSKKDK
ncbi:flavodoxin-dependent (E)-4-hydroxy-3-methylbut-2-enyl-diphosphate synthase [Malacoplasma penetrans]|uniref:4-hydroxy-3-methylbut-2-en-1-yl diphosphate synthase (flavodoxin) n=1 Tax=Malacoplasma penetrans (strain HF-2) TaxID=272633 RepID=ISPG_MALP2|nr:flavodoxin-dependent (E)-4-hydroxy-3-methylbut-2-enyl-diphosphate synthase [Malacoplasma penetrans]Q8EUI6.1 RecName: Full=4-hydroxy-3-methylbut-2-en-1-yl diphosphate synthase (flavodoxin); AltName: Full=1-hydroxy-2-methyl-2-(E)-butenyl 4-diphosphate synthase [Malacoplasma penetrans HF-2]RXY97140.1 flavodoxin-dependent (E)-4-hydroxy-3-methylbut-2-enyl-diphosphate synthase [Malacoplasma penetrans]BAC44727.1 peptidoglycan acetylation [Malacoplasma penetrans HF-2]